MSPWRFRARHFGWAALLLATTAASGANPPTFWQFDVPDFSPGTLFVAGLNDGGAMVGNYGTPSGTASIGFTRMRRGPLITPVVHPNDTDGFTNLRTLNNLGVVAGFYVTLGVTHGFLYSGGEFTTWDLPGATGGTQLRGINDRGDLAGTFTLSRHGEPIGFIAPSRGPVITFRHPNPAATNLVVGKINDQRTVVGYYTTASSVLQGFVRSADGTFTDIAVAGADSTQLFGINDCGVLVGTYALYAKFSDHGYYGRPGHLYLFDVPGSLGTRARGINNRGQLIGDFLDAQSIWHVFVTDKLPHAGCVE